MVVEKQTTLPLRSQIVILVYHTSLLDNRDFLFKPTIAAISLYIYLVDNTFHSVVARNNTDALVIIPKHLRLGTVSKIDYDNCYLATSQEAAKLALAPASNNA